MSTMTVLCPKGPGVSLRTHQSRSPSGPPLNLWARLHRWLERLPHRNTLLDLADDRRRLDDVGLTREQVMRAAGRYFWQ